MLASRPTEQVSAKLEPARAAAAPARSGACRHRSAKLLSTKLKVIATTAAIVWPISKLGDPGARSKLPPNVREEGAQHRHVHDHAGGADRAEQREAGRDDAAEPLVVEPDQEFEHHGAVELASPSARAAKSSGSSLTRSGPSTVARMSSRILKPMPDRRCASARSDLGAAA